MSKPDPRKIAFKILNRLEKEGVFLNALMQEFLPLLPSRDRSLMNAIVYGVLRWRGRLDWIIKSLSKTPVSKIDSRVMNILRIGLFQIIYMDKIPASAAVNTSVEITKSFAKNWVVRYVNGLLRNAARKNPDFSFPDPKKNHIKWLAVTKSYPEWLIKRWLKQFGKEETERLCDACNIIPPITVRINTLKTSEKELIKDIETQVESLKQTHFASNAISFYRPLKPIAKMKSFQKGWFQVQDEAAQLVTAMLYPKPGETILDACAGLGGKTGHIGQLMQNQGRIIAVDQDEKKLSSLSLEMKRLGISIVETMLHDWNEPLKQSFLFDRILLDAPCSGLGIIRRNPDAKWNKTEKSLIKLHNQQLLFLKNTAPLLKPGGCLVYAVCSIELEENEEVIKKFLEFHPDFHIMTENSNFLPELQAIANKSGWLKIFPYHHNTDGFFIICLKSNTPCPNGAKSM
ncbi:16S rRNA (cytosine967-C5)-methyltransferase [Candidatus Magnetomoraceae bacterium gMMP-13]